MFANQIGRVDEVVAVLSLISAIASFVMSGLAAREGLIKLRPGHAAVATVSLIYVAGYVWLILGTPTSGEWSSVMRGFSLVAWVVVWIVPAWVSLALARELRRAIKERSEL